MSYMTTSIIGLSKNAGKTTLLNYLISIYHQASYNIGLTSIGVDGESIDSLYGYRKPLINVPEGAIIATASSGLSVGTAKWRILEKLDISSSVGQVYVAEAIKSGTVKLLGTPTVDHIAKVFSAFGRYGVQKVLVDGAFDRKASANPLLTSQTYLVIGASLSQDEAKFKEIIYEKLFPLFYPLLENNEIKKSIAFWNKKDEVLIKVEGRIESYPSTYLLTASNYIEKDFEWLVLPGILTEQMLRKMLYHKKITNIVLKDGLKSFISSDLVKKWKSLGGVIQVINRINIKGIAYNPYAPEGYFFSPQVMKENIEQIVQSLTDIKIPIFDVWRDEYKED